ncbi:hypothetical protein KAR10_00575 [bacterium]|nr:hypothetical protein [bacterium]
MPEVTGIQLVKGGRVFYSLWSGKRLELDSFCVVETKYGPNMARVVRPKCILSEDRIAESTRRILRPATDRDQEQFKNNERREKEARRICRKKILEKGLSMKLVDVSYTLDARKAVFYFTAENRVDFRELVKELARALKIKIEMRQIGVRDEARRLGGVGCCGRSLCCCTFLKDFVSVSIRLAKDQNLSLNPSKISGVCGRLMCCLSYGEKGSREKRVVREEKVKGKVRK